MQIKLPDTPHGGIPSNPMPDSAAIHAEDRPVAVDHELAAKQQIRRAEGYHTSEKTERIDKEIAELEQAKAETEPKLDQASADYADNKNGAAGRVSQLRTQLRDTEDKIEALTRARQFEMNRLAKEYESELQRRQAAFLDRVEAATVEANKDLKTAENALQELEEALGQAEQSMRLVANSAHSDLLGRHIHSQIYTMRQFVGVRLDVLSDGGPGSTREMPLTVHSIDADNAKRRAEVPDYLTDLPPADG